MFVVLATIAALLVCALAGFSAWSATINLRLGKYVTRYGIVISRREEPIIFWFYILLGFAPLTLCLFIGLGIAYLFFEPTS
jgi:hypothetical protein